MSEARKKIFLFGTVLALVLGTFQACNRQSETEIESTYDHDNDDFTPTKEPIITPSPTPSSTPVPTEVPKETPKAVSDESETKEEEKSIVYVSDNKELREYLDYDHVSFDEVRNALHKNKNINDFYKEQISIFIDTLEENAPNIDLTCFYENLKKYETEEISREEMTKRKGENVDAYTSFNIDTAQTWMTIVETDIDFHDIAHELSHLFNYLVLETDKYIIVRQYEDQNGKGNSWSEGLTEWFNLFLFPSNSYSYPQQVADVKLAQSILKKSNVKMAEEFAEYDYNNLYDQLAKYLDLEELDQLYNYLDKEIKHKIGKEDAEQITTSEIQNKYDTLLKAMITSRAGALDSSEVYDIAKVFENSISVYFETTYEEDKKLDSSISDYLNQRILTTLLKYGIDKNNTVTIYKEDEDELLYYDINQLYFAVNLKKDQLTFIEKSVDAEGNVSYTDLKNIGRKDLSGYKIYLLSDLIEDVDTLDSITMNDVLEAYENQYSTAKQKVYE